MRDQELYEQILGLRAPWSVKVKTVELDQNKQEVRLMFCTKDRFVVRPVVRNQFAMGVGNVNGVILIPASIKR